MKKFLGHTSTSTVVSFHMGCGILSVEVFTYFDRKGNLKTYLLLYNTCTDEEHQFSNLEEALIAFKHEKAKIKNNLRTIKALNKLQEKIKKTM
jgi:hypothetical protein